MNCWMSVIIRLCDIYHALCKYISRRDLTPSGYFNSKGYRKSMQNASPDTKEQLEITNSLEIPIAYSRADIHMHTNLGDGWASPARVIEEATRKGTFNMRVISKVTVSDGIVTPRMKRGNLYNKSLFIL